MVSKDTSKPMLFATLGYPGSGKTFFSRQFASEQGIFHLNSDRLRLEMFLHPTYSEEESEIVFRTMDYIAIELLKMGTSVIYDANSTKREYRIRLEEIAAEYDTNFLLLWMKTPFEEALRRNKERGLLTGEQVKNHRTVNEAAIYRLKNQEEPPTDEFYVSIDGELPYEKQKEVVLNFIKDNL